jgi:spore coat polysaccharide biosynthesis predicted glycosyltransferase SpsG
MLKDDFETVFATVNPTDYQKSELSGICPCINLNRETHFEDFLSILHGDEIVVLDNYFFTTDYQRAVKKKGCRLVCIDDMHDKHYVADIVINHGIDNPALFSVEPYTRLCLGLEWALLRRPFIEASVNDKIRKNSPKIENIAISFGGVDMYHLTDQWIEILCKNKHIQRIDAIVGKEYQTSLPISSLVNVVFHRSVSAHEVVNILSGCDLSIVSASTVCLEALACHARVAAGYYVDNQKEFYKYLKINNFIVGLDSLFYSTSFNVDNFNFPVYDFVFNDLCNRYLIIFNELCG